MKKIIAALALSIFVAAPAVAAGTDNLYVGAQFGSTSCSGCTSSTTGFGGLVGYTIDKSWAVEGSYNLLGKYTFPGGDVTFSSMAVHGVYSYPINNQFTAIGKIGFSSVTTKTTMPQVCGGGVCFGGNSSVSDSGLAYGIGGVYSLDKHIGIRVGYDISARSGGSLNTLYAGGVYKF